MLTLLIGLIVISFMFADYRGGGGGPTDKIGEVGDIPIKYREFQVEYDRNIKFYGQYFGRGKSLSSKQIRALKIKDRSIGALVDRKLMMKFGEDMGAYASQAEVKDSIKNYTEGGREIFKTKGENYFRHLEQGQIKNLKSQKNGIIATGGGTPCHLNNLELMKKMGQVIYLKTDTRVLFERIKQERSNRPLIKDIPIKDLAKYIEKELKYRAPIYSKANIIIESTNLTPEEICQEIITKCY